MKYLRNIWILVLILPLALGDCSKPKEEANCSGTVSFRSDIIPILSTRCALSGCHTGANPTGSLRLDSAFAYHEIIHDGYAIAGKPSYSIIYNQMLGTGGVPIMPPTGQLDHTITDKVSCWIQQGALDN